MFLIGDSKKTEIVEENPFHFRPVASHISTEKILYHRLDEIEPLANTMAKIRFLMKEHKEKIVKYQANNVLKRSPFKRIALEEINFYNDSKYTGEWNYLGMDGVGIYKYPDGTTYVGEMQDGLFSGTGALRFPNGGILRGKWESGILKEAQYVFKDGLLYNSTEWGYCKMPDRRFHSEILDGLKPAGNIQMASEHPAPYVWPGCYDTVEGFYNPKTKELVNITTGKVIRIVNKPEEEWILKNCRRHGELPFPFNPQIYENWFPESIKPHPKSKLNEFLWNYLLYDKGNGMLTEDKPNELRSKQAMLAGKKCIMNNKPLFP